MKPWEKQSSQNKALENVPDQNWLPISREETSPARPLKNFD